MSLGLPALTPEQFKQVVAHYAGHHGSLRLSCVALGFMSLEQLRTIVAEEQAAASMSTHSAAPRAAPAAELERSAAPAPVAGASLTKQQIAERVQAHAAANGTTFVEAFKALGFEASYHAASHAPAAAAAPAAAPARPERQAQADQASAYAREHGVDFVTACQVLGFDGEKAAARAQGQQRLQRAQKYAAEHRVGLGDALQAVGHAAA